MSQINYIQGDLFANTKREIVGHGCNASGGFGSGVAGQISKRFPEVRDAYRNKFQREGFSLGEIQLVPLRERSNSNIKVIANLITQKTYGKTGIHVDYEACFLAFSKLFRYALTYNYGVAMPMIGNGYGGGEWLKIEEIILKILVSYELEVDVYQYERKKRT